MEVNTSVPPSPPQPPGVPVPPVVPVQAVAPVAPAPAPAPDGNYGLGGFLKSLDVLEVLFMALGIGAFLLFVNKLRNDQKQERKFIALQNEKNNLFSKNFNVIGKQLNVKLPTA